MASDHDVFDRLSEVTCPVTIAGGPRRRSGPPPSPRRWSTPCPTAGSSPSTTWATSGPSRTGRGWRPPSWPTWPARRSPGMSYPRRRVSSMALELPDSLSPSKVSTFTDCALAFRFSGIDRLPEPPSVPATKGTLVHAALERLFVLDPPSNAPWPPPSTALDQAVDALRASTPSTSTCASTPRPRPPSSTTPSASCAATSSSRIRPPSPRSASSSCSRPRSAACASAASSTGSSSTTTASSSSPTTRPDGCPAELTSRAARRRALLRLPVRAPLRPAPGPGPAAVPRRARRHHHHAERAVDPRARAQGRRHLDRGRAGVRRPTTSDPSRPAVRLVRLPGLLPGVRRRPRRSRPPRSIS